jgi:hypothetical protein
LSASMALLSPQPHTGSNHSAGNCAADQLVVEADGLRRWSGDHTKHSPKTLIMSKVT